MLMMLVTLMLVMLTTLIEDSHEGGHDAQDEDAHDALQFVGLL